MTSSISKASFFIIAVLLIMITLSFFFWLELQSAFKANQVFNKNLTYQAPSVDATFNPHWGFFKDQQPEDPIQGEFSLLFGTLVKTYEKNNEYWIRILTPQGFIDVFAGIANGEVGYTKALEQQTEQVIINNQESVLQTSAISQFNAELQGRIGQPIGIRLATHNTLQKQALYYSKLRDECKNSTQCMNLLSVFENNLQASYPVYKQLFSNEKVLFKRVVLPISAILVL